MKKQILILAALALAVGGCKEEAKEKKETPSAEATTEATAEKDEAGVIELEKLTQKGDVYYLNNAPYTGTAWRKKPCCEHKWEMKDGRFHGKYAGNFFDTDITGTYKDGKKHGEWKETGKLHLTQTWENDVLISENGVLISDFEKLTLKGDVYYLNNAPFTGKARIESNDGGAKTEWEMKDGKFHGKYTESEDMDNITGTYKDGKKHGEWMFIAYHMDDTSDRTIGIYKDDKKHGEWEFFNNKGELERTETWENDVLVKEWSADTANTLTDSRDGKKYKTVQIGEQVWMAENLNYEAQGSKCFGEGDRPVVIGEGATTTLSPSEVQANCTKYGRLYNWETAKKGCPAGWHLPSKDEWETLVKFAGGDEVAGKKLKATSSWDDYRGTSGNGTDEFGFSALPGGLGSSDGSFSDVNEYGLWWSASECNSDDAYYRLMGYNFEEVQLLEDRKASLLSVRCIKDK